MASKMPSTCCVCYDIINSYDTHVQCMRCIEKLCQTCDKKCIEKWADRHSCPACRHDELVIEIGNYKFDGVTIDLT